MPDALLSFKIGPVQPFIEAARTLRDLWSGSYLLSWLTAHAMKPLIEKYGCAAFITPHMTAENPVVRAVMSKTPTKDEAVTLACLPHTFAVVVPTEKAEELKAAVVKVVRDEWRTIAEAVRKALREDRHIGDRVKPYLDSANWSAQIETFFEITVVVRPNGDTKPDSPDWAVNEWEKLSELLEMTRSVRHVPAYSPTPDEKGRFPVKCSQLGSLEQMGPADFDKAKAYWAGLTRKGNDEKPPMKWDGLHGTGLQSSDKLCAVALVKRFMWPAYLAGKLGLDVRELRLTDTATMAARKWLGEGDEKIDPKVEWRESESRHWSGQWLHWPASKEDDDAICPQAVWDRIEAKRRAQGRPPTYFALMHLDGDNMGDLFAGEAGPLEWGCGVGRYRKITESVTKFARDVRAEVLKCHGELIYAGGDDVLAFLPTDEAIACATAIHKLFCDVMEKAKWPEGQSPSLSGGIAVVHYKEDLRFALGQVRVAEKAAKRIGKAHGDEKTKDALALAICKRSGEHSTVVMGWPEAENLQPLIAAFVAKASDRWAYKLREEVDRLTQPADRAQVAWAVPGPLLALGKAETMRLVGRGEFGSEAKKKEFLAVIAALFEAYQTQMQSPARGWTDADVLTGFVALCQSASFLARGKE